MELSATVPPPATRSCQRLILQSGVDAGGQVTRQWVEQDRGWYQDDRVTLAAAS